MYEWISNGWELNAKKKKRERETKKKKHKITGTN